jgi:hypothetical protein
MRLIGHEVLGIDLQRHALTPLDVDVDHVEALALAEVDPKMGELAEARGQDLAASQAPVPDEG